MLEISCEIRNDFVWYELDRKMKKKQTMSSKQVSL